MQMTLNSHLLGEKQNLINIISILGIFLNVLSLELNWDNSIACYCTKKTPKPKWTTSGDGCMKRTYLDIQH
jgi:hypothetical protein